MCRLLRRFRCCSSLFSSTLVVVEMTTAAVVVAINLGSIRVASKQSGAAGAGATWTALTLSSSFSVALPPSWPASTTASELAASSRRGDIWIAKAGSCLAEVETLIDGGRSHVGVSPELDAVELLEIADLVAGCAVRYFFFF